MSKIDTKRIEWTNIDASARRSRLAKHCVCVWGGALSVCVCVHVPVCVGGGRQVCV